MIYPTYLLCHDWDMRSCYQRPQTSALVSTLFIRDLRRSSAEPSVPLPQMALQIAVLPPLRRKIFEELTMYIYRPKSACDGPNYAAIMSDWLQPQHRSSTRGNRASVVNTYPCFFLYWELQAGGECWVLQFLILKLWYREGNMNKSEDLGTGSKYLPSIRIVKQTIQVYYYLFYCFIPLVQIIQNNL